MQNFEMLQLIQNVTSKGKPFNRMHSRKVN